MKSLQRQSVQNLIGLGDARVGRGDSPCINAGLVSRYI
jgi:hypothetical protein